MAQKKRTSVSFPKVLDDLVKQTAAAWKVVGIEQSHEENKRRVREQLDAVWNVYLLKTLCDELKIAPKDLAMVENKPDDEEID